MYCWNETADKILPVFAHFLWALIFIFSSSSYFISLAFRKCETDCNILKIILVKGFCPRKTDRNELHDFLSDLVSNTDLLKISFSHNNIIVKVPTSFCVISLTAVYLCFRTMQDIWHQLIYQKIWNWLTRRYRDHDQMKNSLFLYG